MACLEWLPLELFPVRNGFRMRACRECRRDRGPVALERYGESSSVPDEPPHVRGSYGERELRFWLRSTPQHRTHLTCGRYFRGELVSSTELMVSTPERAFRVAATWCAWLRLPGPPQTFG